MPFTVGETVGPYRLLEQLGQGGMATVFKAYHPALDRYVAIKALHPAFTADPNFLTRFQREAQVVARLEHPNIVPVYDYAEHEGRPYLVMKFIEGETLKARLKRAPLENAEIGEIVESVGAALYYAHHQGVLHRDVKPSNVLLAHDGRIYLADFGLARIAQAGESTISSDVMLGTPQYISPEQALGQRELDSGTDIYSFGVLLYEMLVGRVPYSADTPYSIIHDHIYTPLPLPRNIDPDIPEAIERVLLKALAKDRNDRFPDVNSLVEAWSQAAEGMFETQQISPAQTQPEVQFALADAVFEEPLLVDGEPAIDEVGVESQPLPADPSQDHGAVVAPERKPKRLWLIIAGVLLACCVCTAGAFVAFPRLRGRVRQLITSQAASTQVQPIASDVPTEPIGEGSPGSTIEAAQQKVSAEPDNPSAYLELAAAYWDAGMFDEANRTFEAGFERSKSDPKYLIQAGDFMRERELWLDAAKFYGEAMKLIPVKPPPELQEYYEMSLYLGADDPALEEVLLELPKGRVELEFIEIIRARHSLYQGEMMRVKVITRRLNEKQSDRRELKLLEAEIFHAQGNDELASEKLEGLLNDPAAPRWVRLVAQHILEEVIP